MRDAHSRCSTAPAASRQRPHGLKASAFSRPSRPAASRRSAAPVERADDPKLVQEAIRVTALVTVGMMILGTLFPAFFRRISSALTVALLVVIVVELVEIFVFRARHGILDWIVVVIFCGYIGYDWGRANQIPKTLDNAIDSAAALYMDIINLFLRILRILGRK